VQTPQVFIQYLSIIKYKHETRTSRSSDGPTRHPNTRPVGPIHPSVRPIRPPTGRTPRRAPAESYQYIPVAGNTDDCRAWARQCHYLLGGLRVCMGTFPFPTLPSSTWILGRNGRRRRYPPPSLDDAVNNNHGGAVAELLFHSFRQRQTTLRIGS